MIAGTAITPGPWRVGFSDGSGDGSTGHGAHIVGPNDTPVVSGGDSFGVNFGVLKREDADFIVRACNSHAGLLNAALAASHALKSYQYGNGSPDLARDCAAALDAALAKAEGK